MIDATPLAVSKIKNQITKRGKGLGIRIGVKTTGCSGLAYVLEFVDQESEYDEKIEFAGFNIYIDKKSVPYIQNLTIDYKKNGLNEGFEFINPNEKGRCGCGESFTV